jgi:hypothetical protein
MACAVGIKIFHIAFIQECLVKLFGGAEPFFDYYAVRQTPQFRLHERPQVSRRYMDCLETYI